MTSARIHRGLVACCTGASMALLALTAAGSATATERLDPAIFPLPDNLRPNVAFWEMVYATHGSDRALLHDERHLSVIYEVIDFSDLEDLPETRRRLLRRGRVREAQSRWETLLGHLAAGRRPESLRPELARLEALFADVPGGRDKYRQAMGRLRSQTCLRNRFAEGIERSGAFLPKIETIFREKGLPIALTRLPFVESLFHPGARSHASAGGIWQFVPATARRYLTMELEFDERFDPLRAADAAADHLAGNHRALGTWPLALTAYNHGRYGMMRAVRMLGTRDLGVIVDRYRSRTFGFASRNFYSEFVAAHAVYEDRAQRFPGLMPQPEAKFASFVPDDYVDLPALARAAQVPEPTLRLLNPALADGIWKTDIFVPAGYDLRVPPEALNSVRAAYASLGDDHRSSRQKGVHYKVRSGDTLAKIAGKFGSSIRAIQSANKLRSANVIRVGQVLYIPSRGARKVASSRRTAPAAAASTPTAAPRASSAYQVRAGDSLSGIARRHGTSVQALRAANGLRHDVITIGQRLRIPAGGRTHVVRRGETLAAIARRYGTTVSALRSNNRLRGDVIHPAQVLVIP